MIRSGFRNGFWIVASIFARVGVASAQLPNTVDVQSIGKVCSGIETIAESGGRGTITSSNGYDFQISAEKEFRVERAGQLLKLIKSFTAQEYTNCITSIIDAIKSTKGPSIGTLKRVLYDRVIMIESPSGKLERISQTVLNAAADDLKNNQSYTVVILLEKTSVQIAQGADSATDPRVAVLTEPFRQRGIPSEKVDIIYKQSSGRFPRTDNVELRVVERIS